MNPLAMNQRVLSWICICPTDSGVKKRICMVYSVTMPISLVTVIVTSALYFNEFAMIDLGASMYALYQIVVSLSMEYIIISAYIVRKKFNKIFTDLKEIYKLSKTLWYCTFCQWKCFSDQIFRITFKTVENKETFHILVQTNELCEWMWPMYFKFMVTILAVALVLTAFSIWIGYYITGDFSTKYLYRPFKWK